MNTATRDFLKGALYLAFVLGAAYVLSFYYPFSRH